ncbi:exocyst subunit exo70 family protein G1 [Zostera marina]|uniref:Exocyst subunit Exo70 family protein n=1 Tax=Zostera marina TaxID=29655 RepID=A0A0K9PVJ6_ZOSMR|nr:exocyst subunit exo70 family protein G1 [Zostera marina]
MAKITATAIDHVKAARACLQTTITSSQSITRFLSTESRVDPIRRRLCALSTALRPISADQKTLDSFSSQIDEAIIPAAAILRVFDTVHRLEFSLLSETVDDISAYLTRIRQLEEALSFLSDKYRFAVEWLEDIVDYIKKNSASEHGHTAFMNDLVISIKQAGLDLEYPLDGGLLDAALNRLESKFRSLIKEHSVPLLTTDLQSIACPPLPVDIIQQIVLIMERMMVNDRIDRCVKIYVEVRGNIVNSSLRSLGLDYLNMSNSDFTDVKSIENDIVMWGKHLEFSIKHLFDAEYELCLEIFEKFGSPELGMGCFADIAAQAGILRFLRFGLMVTNCKKDPIKLLKLLDIFVSLNSLRSDFNKLFGGKPCAEIKNVTRELIKKLIDGACEIFYELLNQVELQRSLHPPINGGLPTLIYFMTDYCNILLSNEYEAVLSQVLKINRSWKGEKFQDSILTDAVIQIILALVQNLDTWSKLYEDKTLSYVFLMNAHWYFEKKLRGTKLGELFGQSWLREHEQLKDHYTSKYAKDSWGKLPALLSKEGLELFSGGRAEARGLLKKRLKGFNEKLEEMYRKQSHWVILDKELRTSVRQLAIKTIKPVYISYMQTYGPLVEQDGSSSKYVKYTAKSLEKMLVALFKNNSERSPSFASRHSNGNMV